VVSVTDPYGRILGFLDRGMFSILMVNIRTTRLNILELYILATENIPLLHLVVTCLCADVTSALYSS
jgi:hypothetical protein